MKRILCLLLGLSAAVPLFAEPAGRYIVSMRRAPHVAAVRLLDDPAMSAAHHVRTFRNLDFVALDLTASEAEALRRSPDVEYLAPVVERSINDTRPAPRLRVAPDVSPYQTKQVVPYGIDLVRARTLWQFTRGRGPINVVVMDTGVDYNHPELKDRWIGGYNVFTGLNDPLDDHSHGTHVAGTIAASDNNIGVIGVAPEVRLWGVKVLQGNGSGTDETIMAGLDWVIAKKREIGGNWIINLSLGASRASESERAAFARVIAENILVVAAVGNVGMEEIQFPAAYPGVLAIGAIDSNSKVADFSNSGVGLALVAPGVNVLSSVPVGSTRSAQIARLPGVNIPALPVAGSSLGEVTGQTVYCGFARPEEIPGDVEGKIAIVRRGEILFRDKARNVINAGAIGVVIVPPADDPMRFTWTLLPPSCTSSVCAPEEADLKFPWTVVLSTSKNDGEEMIANAGTEKVTLTYAPDDYAIFNGTSMATPHTAGVAALIWTLAPQATAAQIGLALKMTAYDLGPEGYDKFYGYGRVDALAAARYVSPATFRLPDPPPPPQGRRRSAGNGH